MNGDAITNHLIVKWNPLYRFHPDAPDTITLHCEILAKYCLDKQQTFVWWGKISKSGNLGIDIGVASYLNDQIRRVETHLYLYCPDTVNPSLHVGNIIEVTTCDQSINSHTPKYYSEVNYPIAFWFKISDLKRLKLNELHNLVDLKGVDYDPVSSNFYPMIVREQAATEFFKIRNNFLYELEGKMVRCFKTGSICAKRERINFDDKQIFIGMPFKDKHQNVYEFVLKPTIIDLGYKPWIASDVFSNIDLMCKVCEGIQASPKAIIDISGWNANVLFELGIVFGLSKHAILLKEETEDVPVDLKGLEYISYSFNNFGDLKRKLTSYLTA